MIEKSFMLRERKRHTDSVLACIWCESHFNFCSGWLFSNASLQHLHSAFFCIHIDLREREREKIASSSIYERLPKLNYRLIFQNLRRLNALSIADMGDIPLDLLQSFDELKVLNVSGNHLVNTSLTLLDSVGSLEVSALPNYFIVLLTWFFIVNRNGNGFPKHLN